MKYSDKLQLLLKGVKMDEIKDLEAQEAKENEEAKEAENNENNEKLEEALSMVKELEKQLEESKAVIDDKNKLIESLNNKKTLQEQPDQPDPTSVFKDLFKPSKEG